MGRYVTPGVKHPYHITVACQPTFGFTGLGDTSAAKDFTATVNCTLITMPPNALMAL